MFWIDFFQWIKIFINEILILILIDYIEFLSRIIYKIACLPDDDRRELFRNTADKMGLNDAIVEKDF